MLHYVVDAVTRKVARKIPICPPEWGGGLLGLVDRPVMTDFLFDQWAHTTAATYRPSPELIARIAELERTTPQGYKGILHMHPGRLDRPSGQDERELGTGLGLNPHLSCYLAPIVTAPRGPGPLGPHELAAGDGKISFFVAVRGEHGQTVVRPASAVFEIPLLADLERAGAALGGTTAPEVFVTTVNGSDLLAGRLLLGGVELLLLVPEHYPLTPPLILATERPGETEQVDVRWPLTVAPERRLVEALSGQFGGPGPYRRLYGPRNGPPLTADPDLASQAGWQSRYSGADPERAAGELHAGLRARTAGLLADDLANRTAVIFGAGSVGSYLAEQLARAGVGTLRVLDPESVEAVNLSRTVYAIDDVGQPKVNALSRRLLNVNPRIRVEGREARLQDLAPGEIREVVQQADLVLGATDDPEAQRRINAFAYALGKPALFVGLYAGAQGGEVVVSVPERTACYLCATAARHEVEARTERVTAEVDYGSGRLAGEVALGVDVHHVASAAAKIALALLLPPGSPARLASFAEPAIAGGFSYLTSSTVADYWFYPQIFGETPGQHAYQSVWLTPTRRPDCPVCGEPAQRIDPTAVQPHVLQVGALRQALAALSGPVSATP